MLEGKGVGRREGVIVCEEERGVGEKEEEILVGISFVCKSNLIGLKFCYFGVGGGSV